MVSAAVPTAEGDGLKMAASEGAKLGVYPPIGSAKGFFIAVPGMEFMDEPLYRYCYNVGLPHAFAVNAEGERFCDESFYPRQSDEFYDPTGEYDDFPMYMVFDETYHQSYPLANYKPGTAYPDEFLAGKADTLEALAEQLDIDPETLTSTTARFNEHARTGDDPDFSRGDNEWANIWCGDPHHEPNPNLGPVEEPPFYAVRMYVGLSSMGNVGLLTDDHGRVLDWDDDPIAGLYATGSMCAPVEWGTGYQSGLQNGRSMTYGYLAGQHVASSQ
jgi:3-oxosteroid 1-dehydrogenase